MRVSSVTCHQLSTNSVRTWVPHTTMRYHSASPPFYSLSSPSIRQSLTPEWAIHTVWIPRPLMCYLGIIPPWTFLGFLSSWQISVWFLDWGSLWELEMRYMCGQMRVWSIVVSPHTKTILTWRLPQFSVLSHHCNLANVIPYDDWMLGAVHSVCARFGHRYVVSNVLRFLY